MQSKRWAAKSQVTREVARQPVVVISYLLQSLNRVVTYLIQTCRDSRDASDFLIAVDFAIVPRERNKEGQKIMMKFLVPIAAMIALSTQTFAAAPLTASQKAKLHQAEKTCKGVEEWMHRYSDKVLRCPGGAGPE